MGKCFGWNGGILIPLFELEIEWIDWNAWSNKKSDSMKASVLSVMDALLHLLVCKISLPVIMCMYEY